MAQQQRDFLGRTGTGSSDAEKRQRDALEAADPARVTERQLEQRQAQEQELAQRYSGVQPEQQETEQRTGD